MFSQELIDKTAPGALCIEPMKVWKIPEGKEYKFAEVANSGDYFAELKKDGYWYQFEKTDNKQCSVKCLYYQKMHFLSVPVQSDCVALYTDPPGREYVLQGYCLQNGLWTRLLKLELSFALHPAISAEFLPLR